MKTHYIIVLAIILAVACGSIYEYWDVSKFNMVENALEDNEEVKVIYSSRTPSNEKERDYYIHLVVVSQKTGDTVNILSTFYNRFSETDFNETFIFFNEDNLASKFTIMTKEQISEGMNINDFPEGASPKKVVRDPSYDYIADNNYPTVIGVIGIASENKDQGVIFR